MDTKEVIKKLKSPELPDGLVMVDLETRQEAIKALEKQIQMKPNNIKSIFDFSGRYYTTKGNCPVCNREDFINQIFIAISVDRNQIGVKIMIDNTCCTCIDIEDGFCDSNGDSCRR